VVMRFAMLGLGGVLWTGKAIVSGVFFAEAWVVNKVFYKRRMPRLPEIGIECGKISAI